MSRSGDGESSILRPGPRLVAAVVALTFVGLLVFVHPGLLVLVIAGGAALAIASRRDARAAADALQQIRLTRRMPGVIGRDIAFDDELTLYNDGATVVQGELREVLPSECLPRWSVFAFELAADGESGSTASFATECRIPIRGRHRFGPAWVRVVGPLGLFEAQRAVGADGAIKVLPETFASPETLEKDLGAHQLLLDKAMRSREVGAGTEFVSLFPYRLGDDPRRIDWRATAKHRYPIVRRYQIERHRDVLILIDSGRLMGGQTDRGTKLDCAVDSALNLARVVLQGGDRCGIAVFDSTLRGYLAPMAGERALGNLVDCVYDLQTDWHETDFTRLFAELQQRQAKRCLLVVLSDMGDVETSRLQGAAIARLSRRHLVLFAALRTPLLRRVISRQAESISAAASQVVALGLLRDRGHALHSLRHGGVQVLDVEPQQVTLPLINRFIELRRENRL